MQSSPTSPETSSDVAEHILNTSLKAAHALSANFGVQVQLKKLCEVYLKDLATQKYFCKGLHPRVGQCTEHTYEYGLEGEFIKEGFLESKSFSLQFMLHFVIDERGIKDVLLKIKAHPFSSTGEAHPAELPAVLYLPFGTAVERNTERKLEYVYAVLFHGLEGKVRNFEERLFAEWLNDVVAKWESGHKDSLQKSLEATV